MRILRGKGLGELQQDYHTHCYLSSQAAQLRVPHAVTALETCWLGLAHVWLDSDSILALTRGIGNLMVGSKAVRLTNLPRATEWVSLASNSPSYALQSMHSQGLCVNRKPEFCWRSRISQLSSKGLRMLGRGG
jgi:hypothetical protein